MTSFVCACKRRALICETDYWGKQRYENNKTADEQQLFEMMRVGGGMVYRNQRILQVRELEAESESYYKGPLEARWDIDNDYRKKIRGFANEVEQRAEKRELGFNVMDKLKPELEAQKIAAEEETTGTLP